MDNTEEIYYNLQSLEEEYSEKIISEWRDNKGKNTLQYWRLVPAGLIIKEWKYNAKTGLVHDEIIEKIQTIVIENYLKICINNILFGHSRYNPFEYFQYYFPEDYTEEDFNVLFEGFEDFAIDKNGTWRITDYGTDRMANYIYSLIEEEDYNKKLYWIDLILNVVHQRSDLASWFVENGSMTLATLAE